MRGRCSSAMSSMAESTASSLGLTQPHFEHAFPFSIPVPEQPKLRQDVVMLVDTESTISIVESISRSRFGRLDFCTRWRYLTQAFEDNVGG